MNGALCLINAATSKDVAAFSFATAATDATARKAEDLATGFGELVPARTGVAERPDAADRPDAPNRRSGRPLHPRY